MNAKLIIIVGIFIYVNSGNFYSRGERRYPAERKKLEICIADFMWPKLSLLREQLPKIVFDTKVSQFPRG